MLLRAIITIDIDPDAQLGPLELPRRHRTRSCSTRLARSLSAASPRCGARHRDGVSEPELLRLVAAAEGESEHPLAQAIVGAARERGLDAPRAESFEAGPGHGAIATVEGRRLAIGNQRLPGRAKARAWTGLPSGPTSWLASVRPSAATPTVVWRPRAGARRRHFAAVPDP